MKTKKLKILGVALTLMLVVSLFGFAVPVAAQPGDISWVAQPLPGTGAAAGNVLVNGSDVTDIAVAGDGTTIYAINGAVATGAVYASTDAGQSFTLTPAPAAVTLTAVAVAPDDPQAIAVTNGALVYVSSNGGATWATLPGFAGVWVGATITDLAVGPVRAGTLLSREYAVAVADPTTGVTGGK